MQQPNFIENFRYAAPYINTHRGHRFVLALSGACIANDNFKNIVHDLAVLNSLGIQIVIVYGFRYQIEQRLQSIGQENRYHNGLRITDKNTLHEIEQIAGQLRIQVEASFSKALKHSPLYNNQIRLVSGNFVSAMPMGIIDGIDMQHTGRVRSIDTQTIEEQLARGQTTLISTLAYANTGDIFNLSLHDLALHTAQAINADKLIVFSKYPGLMNQNKQLIRQLNSREDIEQQINPEQQAVYQIMREAANSNISRVHMLSYQDNGALLLELFTHLGAGTLISQEDYETARPATTSDIAEIIALITPLEEKGILIERSREQLEQEIHNFTVIECDQRIIACAALYPYIDESLSTKTAEIACIVTHPQYQKKGIANQLLNILEAQAKSLGCSQIFALSTQTGHWFIEQGFELSSIEKLPQPKQQLYNFQRNSNVLIKPIS